MTVKAVLAGSAGQGALAMSLALARAALAAGREVTCLPSCSGWLPGGPVECTVAVSDQEIASPVASSPQIAVALDEASLGRLANLVAAGGHLLINSTLVHSAVRRQDLSLLFVPASQAALGLGDEHLAHLVMLGALAQATGIVGLDDLRRALAETYPDAEGPELELIPRALQAGAELARQAQRKE